MQSHHRRTIAVIDDNDDNRFIFHMFLEDHHDVVEFSDGERAIAEMKKYRPDVVFLDISLPDVDGIEILRRIRADESLRPLPVVALTAHAMLGDRKRFLELGFDGYFSKPIMDFNQLKNIVENAAKKSASGSGI